MRFDYEQVHLFASELLRALGASPEAAFHVATSLVKADQIGYDTHGVGLLPLYSQMISSGAIVPSASPVAEKITDAICRVDGHLAFGQLTGEEATKTAIESADNHGISVCAIGNGSHLGRLGEWAEEASSRGMVFLAFTNTGGGAKNVAPFGSHERKLSTNPIAFGVPTFGALQHNIIVDFATSQVSGSVIREHDRTGAQLDSEWTITDSGKAVPGARSFMEGIGAMLPLGGRVTGHKGYGLAIIAELLGGLAGGVVVGQEDPEWFSNAAMFIVIDPTRFLSIGEIEEQITSIAEHLRDDNVRLPGEGAHDHKLSAEKSGVDILDYVLESLATLAVDLNVEIPAFLSHFRTRATDSNDKHKTW